MENVLRGLVNEGVCNTDISVLLGIKYDEVVTKIKKLNLKSKKWNQKIYPYIFFNADTNKYYYVLMKSNKKFFYEFDTKEDLLLSIKSEGWECPKKVGEYIWK